MLSRRLTVSPGLYILDFFFPKIGKLLFSPVSWSCFKSITPSDEDLKKERENILIHIIFQVF